MNSVQAGCPICGNGAVAEFFEPSGTALCLRCGAILRRLRDRLAFSYQFEPGRLSLDSALAENLDSLDAVELVMVL